MNFEKKMVRAPYIVEVIEVTEANIEELNKIVGFTDLQRDEEGPFILTNRRVIQHPPRIRPGYFVTKVSINDRLQCFNPTIMAEQFTDYRDVVTFEFDDEGKPHSLITQTGIIGEHLR